MYKNGVIIGKFYPFHKGHAHLIQSASEQCEQLTVLVCTLPDELISGVSRFNAVALTFPDVQVYHVTDILPQDPSEHENFWAIWVDVVKSRVSDVDVVFTSEDYGDPFAFHLGVDHVCIDKLRRTVPISGTTIRRNLYEYWDFIMPAMKPYFQRYIAVVGPESTGKSTLIKQLVDAYEGSVAVPEYGREYVEDISTQSLVPDDFLQIAKGQAYREMGVDPLAPLVFCDTDAFTTLMFYELYQKHNGFTDNKVVREALTWLANKRPYHLYLVTDIDLPWVQDGQRDFGEKRGYVLSQFLEHVKGKPHALISGKGEERFQNAQRRIQQEMLVWESELGALTF